MLTYPSDSLPHIVCPMDEDAIPPNPFCSAPPHSEPPPPLLPLSSITPSCANDGISGHRRSGRIQGIRGQTPKKQSSTDAGATRKPSRQNPSPTERQRESGSMVQVSQSEQPRVKSSHVDEKQNEDGIEFAFAAERQNKQNDQTGPQEKKPNLSAAGNVVEQLADDTDQNPDATKSDMDACGGLALGDTVGNASAPKGWVIGPLFQSFRSKMASFTEIVMSPVKLFRANSPPLSVDHPDKLAEYELQANGASDVGPDNAFRPVRQSETGNREAEADQRSLGDVDGVQNAKTGALKYSKKLAFDVEVSNHSSGQTDECAITLKNSPDSVPLQDSPLPCVFVGSSMPSEPPDGLSASREGKRAVRLKPLPRKRTGNRSELKKVNAKPLVLEVRENPEVGNGQLSQRKNNADWSDAQVLTSSACYTQLDTDCPQPDDDGDGRKIESRSLIRQSLKNDINDSTNGRTPKPTLDTLELESRLNPDTCSAAGFGRAKRGLRPSCNSRESTKRKKLTGDVHTEDTTHRELSNVASDSGTLKAPRPPRKEAVSADPVVDGGETQRPPRKRPAVSTRANRKGKVGQETLPTISEAVSNAQTERSPLSVCSLDKSSGAIENDQKGGTGGSKTKPGGSCRRPKTKTGLCEPEVNIDSMDLETTVAITSTGQAQQEPLSDAFVRSERKQLQSSSSRCRTINKKPLKRKSPIQESSTAESDSTLVSTSSVPSPEPSGLTAADFHTSPPVPSEENLKAEPNQPSKRCKKGFKGAVKSAESDGARKTTQCIDDAHMITKESQSIEGRGKTTTDPVYFEMTPFESNHQPVPSPSQLHFECYVQVNNAVNRDEKEKSAAPAADEVFPADARPRSGARRVKPRRVDNQRRRCRVLHSRTQRGEEMTNSITMEDAELAAAGSRSLENGCSRRLLRSYSCPEIPSLRPHDTPWAAPLHSPHHSRTHAPHQHPPSHAPSVPHAHKSLRRARRHTVCSVEVEREIAPLCLRKEVYPSRRSAPFDAFTQHLSPSLALSPSTSLSVLASCFLSSPLAFLSKKADGRGAAASASGHVSSPSSSFLTSPLSSSSWHLPGFLQRGDSSRAASDSSGSGNPLECEIERRQQSEEEEEEDDGEDTSSSSQEYEDVALREEKALSDSEIKVVQKLEERGKVSSIRIRKTLPKPQNNLTPMGLPKPIRLKKKEFSLEEIYTNKNFSKPPESRLETIFEVPLNRRNGSESWFGQRRVKRFLEFLEVGEARKPKKPLVGVGKSGASSSRTRRGGFARDEPPLAAQDVDSLLCAKLDQLNLWLMHDQGDS